MPTLSGTASREARWQQLQRLFAVQGAVPLAQAAAALKVSAMTIRRDLAVPQAPLSCLGGYVVSPLAPAPASTQVRAPTPVRYTLAEESDQHAPNKRLACRRAAEGVKAGDTLFIDCGTTLPHLAEALPPDIALNIVCYSLNIATILARRPNTQLMLLGGLYNASSASFSSEEALAYLRRLGVNKAFVSAGGVHAGRGASCANFHEVAVKQAAIDCAAESILVVDDSKLGRLRPAFFSPLARFSRIIVGGAPAAALRAQFKGLKLDVVTAPPEARGRKPRRST